MFKKTLWHLPCCIPAELNWCESATWRTKTKRLFQQYKPQGFTLIKLSPLKSPITTSALNPLKRINHLRSFIYLIKPAALIHLQITRYWFNKSKIQSDDNFGTTLAFPLIPRSSNGGAVKNTGSKASPTRQRRLPNECIKHCVWRRLFLPLKLKRSRVRLLVCDLPKGDAERFKTLAGT